MTIIDKRAPMAPAPMKYRDDGEVDWGNMWDSFCALALDGGPPHRGTMLEAPSEAPGESEAYQQVVAEICRGIYEVSGLPAHAAESGWVAVQCQSAAMARWLSDAIIGENVRARYDGSLVYVPADAHFSVKGEIKNVITAVAKTSHYWDEHLANEIKQTVAVQVQLEAFGKRMRRWLGRG
jgi:sirohydrochlorin cobaltochelatase